MYCSKDVSSSGEPSPPLSALLPASRMKPTRVLGRRNNNIRIAGRQMGVYNVVVFVVALLFSSFLGVAGSLAVE